MVARLLPHLVRPLLRVRAEQAATPEPPVWLVCLCCLTRHAKRCVGWVSPRSPEGGELGLCAGVHGHDRAGLGDRPRAD